MAISVKNIYSSEAKRVWRSRNYDSITIDSTYKLVDANNQFVYRWLELVGNNAETFTQLLQTGRINESQLIGLDYGTKNSATNIKKCKNLFPNAHFEAIDWVRFCNKYPYDDIGVIVFDGFTSFFGNTFMSALTATLELAKRCSNNIGECVVILNVDADRARSLKNSKDGNVYDNTKAPHQIFKENIESTAKELNLVLYLNDDYYSYSNTNKSSTMMTYIIKI